MLLSGLGFATEIHIATAAARRKCNIIFSTYVPSWPVLPGERFRHGKTNHQSQDPTTAVSTGHSFCPWSSQNSSSVRQPGQSISSKKTKAAVLLVRLTDSRVEGSTGLKLVL